MSALSVGQTSELFAQPEFGELLGNWQTAALRVYDSDREDSPFRPLEEAKTKVLEFAEAAAGPFVVYGLRNFLNLNAADISQPVLRSRVEEAEERLNAFNSFIRNHAGEILTVFTSGTNDLSVTAGRLGSEDTAITWNISQFLENGVIRLPKASNSTIYSAHRWDGKWSRGLCHHFVAYSSYVTDDELCALSPAQAIEDPTKLVSQNMVLVVGEIPDTGHTTASSETEQTDNSQMANELIAKARELIGIVA